MGQDDHFNIWLNQLEDLPQAPYEWITQIAYEMADGIARGFWNTSIASQVTAGWRPGIGLEGYVTNRESQAVFDNVSASYDRRKFGVIIESLVMAGFCERTRLSSENRAWLTTRAFELLKYPQRMKAQHVQKTAV